MDFNIVEEEKVQLVDNFKRERRRYWVTKEELKDRERYRQKFTDKIQGPADEILCRKRIGT